MEEHREEFDEAHYQLMMDIYTRPGNNAPSPSRWWIGLGLALVVLGGATGLLLATGNYTYETSDSKHRLVPTLQDPGPQLRAQEFPEREDLPVPSAVSQEGMPLSDTPEESHPTVTQLTSGSRAGLGSGSISSPPPTAPRHPKALSAQPSQMRQSQRTAACPENDCRRQVTRQRSIPHSERSLLHEFDPNAARVLSMP